MYKGFKLLIFISVITGNIWGSNIKDNFIFNIDKLDIGTLYIYETSDYSGSNLGAEYLYIKDENSYETLINRYHVGEGLWYNKLNFNREYFMYDRVDFETLATTNNEYDKYVNFERNFKDRKCTGERKTLRKGKIKTSSMNWEIDNDAFYPFFHAGNCVSDLAISLRFLNRDKKGVTIGINDVYSKNSRYEIIYEKEEVIEGKECLKYILKPEGFFAGILDKSGAVWIKKGDPNQTMIKYQLNQRITSSQKNEMAILRDVKKLSYSEWQEFIKEVETNIDMNLEF